MSGEKTRTLDGLAKLFQAWSRTRC